VSLAKACAQGAKALDDVRDQLDETRAALATVTAVLQDASNLLVKHHAASHIPKNWRGECPVCNPDPNGGGAPIFCRIDDAVREAERVSTKTEG